MSVDPETGTHPPAGMPGADAPAARKRAFAGAKVQWFRNRIAIPLVLVVLPLLIYGQAIFQRYGFRDDYSVIREAREEPAKLVGFFGAQGRPLSGWLLKVSARQTPTINDIRWLRVLGAVGVGALAAGFYLVLLRLQWSACLAALTAALLVSLPSAQILVSWGIAWPLAAGSCLGLAAFAAAEEVLMTAQPWRRMALLAAALLCLLAGALIYQPSVMFYVAGVAASVGRRQAESLRRQIRRLAWHAVTLGMGLMLAFDVTNWLFAAGIFSPSKRIAFAMDLPGKLQWYVTGPLANALALFALNDVSGRRIVSYSAMIIAVLALLAGSIIWVRHRRGNGAALFWLACLLGLPLAAGSVSILVAERWSSYRTLYACAAVVLVFLMSILGRWWAGRRRRCLGVLAAGAFLALMVARWQAYALIARPQVQELRQLEDGARAIDPAKKPRAFVLTLTAAQAPSSVRWADEFGSLSMDSDWTPKEALQLIMRERFPDRPDVNQCYSYMSGRVLPKTWTPDVLIDMHPSGNRRSSSE